MTYINGILVHIPVHIAAGNNETGVLMPDLIYFL